MVQVHGCFWHGHDCPMFKVPATRTDFWTKKINWNRARDQKTFHELQQGGWRSQLYGSAACADLHGETLVKLQACVIHF